MAVSPRCDHAYGDGIPHVHEHSCDVSSTRYHCCHKLIMPRRTHIAATEWTWLTQVWAGCGCWWVWCYAEKAPRVWCAFAFLGVAEEHKKQETPHKATLTAGMLCWFEGVYERIMKQCQDADQQSWAPLLFPVSWRFCFRCNLSTVPRRFKTPQRRCRCCRSSKFLLTLSRTPDDRHI